MPQSQNIFSFKLRIMDPVFSTLDFDFHLNFELSHLTLLHLETFACPQESFSLLNRAA